MKIEIRFVAAAIAFAAGASCAQEYRRFTPDEPLVDWRGANATVRQAAGPGAHGDHGGPAPSAPREAMPEAGPDSKAPDSKSKDPPTPKPADAAVKAAPNAHAGHGHSGHAGHGSRGSKP